ncbi:MAG: NADH-quinone oxidoreductase subunit B, partial [Pseudomonadota bacterium]
MALDDKTKPAGATVLDETTLEGTPIADVAPEGNAPSIIRPQDLAYGTAARAKAAYDPTNEDPFFNALNRELGDQGYFTAPADA